MEDSFDGMETRASVAKGPMFELEIIAKAILTVELQKENVDQFLDKKTAIQTLNVFKSFLVSHAVCLARLQEAQKELCALRLKDLTTTKKEY